jgi:hypothetical protein
MSVPHFDVDAIAEITSYADYMAFSAKLRKLGFAEDTSHLPLEASDHHP